MKIKNVLSLFDGMSCGQIALNRAGIEYDKYYASEIDKYAIQIAKKNYPNTIHLGDVTKWKEWDIDWSSIGLLIGGSPCQGFSFAGKQLAFDDPRSKLFFVYVDILNHIKQFNPDVKFMLENVRMKKEHQAVITEYLGIEPVIINSALVSAQNRVRYYWTNIGISINGLFSEVKCGIEQPQDKGILLKDILEQGDIDEKYYLSDKLVKYITNKKRLDKKFTAIDGEKSLPMMANYANSSNGSFCVDCNGREDENKTGTITASYAKGTETNGSRPFIKEKSGCFTAGAHSGGKHSDMDIIPVLNERQMNNLKSNDDKANTFLSTSWKGSQANGMSLVNQDYRFRRLTPIEVERLQTVPDNYTQGVSDTQRYRMLGNGWTVDVIVHIFGYLK